MKKAIKEILLVLIFGLIIFTTNACADVCYEVAFVPGATPTDVLGRNYQLKYALHTITPVQGKENTFILRFLNDSEPLYLAEVLRTSKYILKVKLLK